MAKTSGKTGQARATKRTTLQLKKDTLKDLAPKRGKAVKGGTVAVAVATYTDCRPVAQQTALCDTPTFQCLKY